MPALPRYRRGPGRRDGLLALILALTVHAGALYLGTRTGHFREAAPSDSGDGVFDGQLMVALPPAVPQPAVPSPESVQPVPSPLPLPIATPEPIPRTIAGSTVPLPIIMSVPPVANDPTANIRTIPKTEPNPRPAAPRVATRGHSSGGAAHKSGPVSGANVGSGRASGSGITGIRYLYNPRPPYPPEARQMRLQGVVIVGADISATGRVTLATVARSCGHAILDEAAVEAVRLWIFTPAREGGENVATHAEIPVRFSLAQ